MSKLKKHLFKFCPKSGKVVGFNLKSRLLWISFPVIGLFALIWFLVRVVPKPSRASYPCQRAAAPIAASFVAGVLGVLGSAAIFKKAWKKIYQSRYLAAGFLIIAGVALSVIWSMNSLPIKGSANKIKDGANQPVGEGRGVFPGRVTWVHDPEATSFSSNGKWWEDAYNNQAAIDRMVSLSVQNLSGQSTDDAAWDSIFKNFNQRKGKGTVGYKAGEKIAIKINQNNTTGQVPNNNINASPHMVLALLKTLINSAGVEQKNITVFDSSRYITDNIFNKCRAMFPDVVFVDIAGGNGRVKATHVNNAIPYSINNGNQITAICSSAVEANYLIDMALLKGHTLAGVTLCAKNLYGVTKISTDIWSNPHNNFYPPSDGNSKYCTFVDFLGHKDLGEKTVLYMIDALYGHDVVTGTPNKKWAMAPFKNDWTSSLFVSQDGVAIDSVGIDFLRSEFTNLGGFDYCDTYLSEAAQANNAPSKVAYDPERDGVKCTSLGTHEHWNNAVDKKYSRNMGMGKGIELQYVNPKQIPSATPTPVVTNTPTVDPGNTISGYVKPDFSYTDTSLNAGFKVEIEGFGKYAFTNNQGYFIITGSIPSQFTIKISKENYLTRIIENVRMRTVIGSSSDPIGIWAGDISINGVQNNAINMSDIMEVAYGFNSASGDSRYRKNIDLNLDNAINMSDIMIMTKHFNTSSESYPDIQTVK